MPKTPNKVKRALVLPCICSIAFYMGSQIVTHTEAAFSTQQVVKPVLSAAIVFPKTIEDLVKKAEGHSSTISYYYSEINNAAIGHGTVMEMEEQYSLWQQRRGDIQNELTALHTVYAEIDSYYNMATENVKKNDVPSAHDVLEYVQAGFEQVQHMKNGINEEAMFQTIDSNIAALGQAIEDEKQRLLEEEKKKQQEALKKAEEEKKQAELQQPEQPEQPEQTSEPTEPTEQEQSANNN